MSSWVLCGKNIVKNSDKNLVHRQESSTFNVPEELLSLESIVAIDFTYICRNWLLTKEENGASDKSFMCRTLRLEKLSPPNPLLLSPSALKRILHLLQNL